MSASPDPDDSVTFTVDPDVSGFPAVVDAAFRDAVSRSKLGGDETQKYFDALNQTSDFWGDLASGAITFAPGVDPQGHPVFMASNGNVELRLKALYAGGSSQGDVAAHASVATRNTTTAVSMWTAVAVRVATMPIYLKLTADLFAKLLVPVYRNTARVLTDLAGDIQQATRAETPSIDALAQAQQLTEAESQIVDDVAAEVGEEGVEYMTIGWTSVALDIAGLAPLMALPMIAEFLGHAMTHALIVQNLTGTDFTWTQSVIHGDSALQPGHSALPGLKQAADVGGPVVTLSSQAVFQVINSTDYGSVGYVLQLQPADGSPAATLVIGVPWDGDNGIWVGSATDAERAYEQHGGGDGQLSVRAEFGRYAVTLSINKLSGETYDSYYYCSTAVIEPIG